MSFNRQERIHIFFLFLREGFLFPFLIIFFSAQVAILHVDGDAVEFNELWAKAERLSRKINEWQQLTPGGWHLHSFCAHADASIGCGPRAAEPSSATHGSLINEVPGCSAIVLFILSISRLPRVEEEPNYLCFWALEKDSPSRCQHLLAPRGSSWLISPQNIFPEGAYCHRAGCGVFWSIKLNLFVEIKFLFLLVVSCLLWD